jgi:ABC-type phosphate transport system permease subunit
MDFEDVLNVNKKKQKKPKKNQPDVKDCDDIGGMTMSMFMKIDVRELFIIWVIFLFVHTELFSDIFLKRFKSATNEDGTMTMKGTLISSLIMMLVVLICTIVF